MILGVRWLAGPFGAVALVLAAGAILKAWKPAATLGALEAVGLPGSSIAVRILSVVEAGIAIGALLVGHRLFAAMVALSYLAFTTFVVFAKLRDVPLSTCGCFGAVDTPPTPVHVVVNLASALVAGAVALDRGWSLPSVMADQPLGGLPFVLLTAITAYLAYLSLTVLPRLTSVRSAP